MALLYGKTYPKIQMHVFYAEVFTSEEALQLQLV